MALAEMKSGLRGHRRSAHGEKWMTYLEAEQAKQKALK